MSIDAKVVGSQPVVRLREMFTAEYGPGGTPPPILNALGACAGFSAQIAVWRELILPRNRNPGDFLVYVTTQSQEVFFFGEAVNQFLFSTGQRASFVTFAAGSVSNPSQLPDIAEIAGHVVKSLGSDSFGRPRLPPPIELPELPRAALARTWGKVAQILATSRPGEWPALLGAAAQGYMDRDSLEPSIAVKIMLEAAVPMSKLNPTTVQGSGVPAPSFANWSGRALRPENSPAIVAEVLAAMPPVPTGALTRPLVIDQPKIVFLNLGGTAFEAIVAEDRKAIGELFEPSVEVAATPARADVLFVYCDIEPSGKIAGQQRSLRDLIRATDAQIAVIASQVPANLIGGRKFMAALSRGDNPSVNLVITLNRNGEKFGHFFRSLFQLMWTGHSMPMAWVRLAPQIPGPRPPTIIEKLAAFLGSLFGRSPARPPHDDGPGTIFVSERGHVGFSAKAPSGA